LNYFPKIKPRPKY